MSNVTSKAETASDNPEWLTTDYFKDVIEKLYKNFSIKSFDIAPAVGKGDNYTAVLHRIKIQLLNLNTKNTIETSFVVKSMPNTKGFQLDLMKSINVFPKEIAIYDKILPAFEKLLHDVGINTVFGPKCYKVSVYPNPTDVIVMEDLIRSKYQMAQRRAGLDMEHCVMLLEKLARYHAASMAYREINGPYQHPFNEGIYIERLYTLFSKMFDSNIEPRFDYIEAWPFGKKYADIFKSWEKEKYFQKIVKTMKTNDEDSGLNVLCHGDLWTNNTLFLYDETNKVSDCVFVDYQLGYWASPAFDLIYFIITSTTIENRLNEFDNFISIYHKCFVETLKVLNYKKEIPTLIELHMEIIKKGFYATFTSLGLLPIILLESRDDASLENIVNDKENTKSLRDALNNNPIYVNAMEKLLPFFERRGYLNLD